MAFEKQPIFPSGGHRKKVMESNKARLEKVTALGPDELYGRYDLIDSSIGSMSETFKPVLPDGSNIREYVENTLHEREGAAVGIEFGGVGSKLFSGFSQGFFERSLGVTIADHRIRTSATKEEKYEREVGDVERNHTVLETDILAPDTHKKIETWLAGRNADLIIERMVRGLEFVPPEPFSMSQIIGQWYQMLSSGGIMLIQVPPVFNVLLPAWEDLLTHTPGIEVSFPETLLTEQESFLKDAIQTAPVRIRRLSNSPNELPLLDPRTVRDIARGK